MYSEIYSYATVMSNMDMDAPVMRGLVPRAPQPSGVILPRDPREWGQPSTGAPYALCAKASTGANPPNVVAPAPNREARPTLAGWGKPHYDFEQRADFCCLFNDGPDAVREIVAIEVLRNPSMGSREMNRHLFNLYGARMAELNQLFDTSGMADLIQKVRTKSDRWAQE